MKKKIYTRKKYAMGGTALNIPSIQEDLFNANRMYQESQIEAATNPLVTGMNMAGSFLTNAGANMIQSGVGEHFANSNPKSGFGKFMKSNSANLGNLLGNGIKTLGMTQHAYGGDVGKKDLIKNKKRNVVATEKIVRKPVNKNPPKKVKLKSNDDFVKNWYNGRKKILNNNNNEVVLPDNSFDFNPMLSEENLPSGTLGTYNPQTKKVALSSFYKDVPGIINHEVNHYVQDQMSDDYKKNYIDNPIKQYTETEKTENKVSHFGQYGNYLLEPDEVHSRLMQFRENNNYKPEDVIDNKRLKNSSNKKLFQLDMFDDDTLINILNKTVDINQVDNSKLTMAKYGGSIDNNILNNTSMFNYLKKKSMGGNVNYLPVEVEGQEVGETPDGEMLDFQGPSHEQGGIPIELPQGTEIYSKRIKVDDVSMADRKKKREKKTYTLEQLLDKNKSDILLKNSLQRTNRTNEIEEDADTKIQQTVSDLLGQQETQKFENGGIVGPNPAKLNLMKLKRFHNSIGIKPTDKGYGTTFGPKSLKAYNTGKYESVWDEENQTEIPSFINNFGNRDMLQSLDLPTPKTTYQKSINNDFNRFEKSATNFSVNKDAANDENDEKPNVLNSILGNVTAGDALGMYGNMYQAKKLMNTIKQNRAGDTANINAFRNYGEKGLAKIDESKQYLKQKESDALSDLNLNRNSIISRNRNSSRSVNGMRALDLASDVNINKNQNEIYANTANGMMNILGQESQLLNNQDAQVMQGEQARDLADRQDRDNYFNQLQQGFLNNGKMISQTGHDLNDMKTRRVTNKLMNSMSPYAQRDIDGNKTVRTDFDRQQLANYGIDDDNFDNMTDEEILDIKHKIQKRELLKAKSKPKKRKS